MVSTLSFEMKKALQDYEKAETDDPKNGRKNFVSTHYGQIVACIA
jgi:dynein heavy chain